MKNEWPAKFGDEVLDYVWDWSARLDEGESIVDVTVTSDGPLVIDSDETAENVTTIWISGGGENAAQAFVDLLAVTDSTPPRRLGERVKLPIRAR